MTGRTDCAPRRLTASSTLGDVPRFALGRSDDSNTKLITYVSPRLCIMHENNSRIILILIMDQLDAFIEGDSTGSL